MARNNEVETELVTHRGANEESIPLFHGTLLTFYEWFYCFKSFSLVLLTSSGLNLIVAIL